MAIAGTRARLVTFEPTESITARNVQDAIVEAVAGGGGGGAGSQTLAEVLAEGADTDGIEIVNVAAVDADAVVTRRATASGDGNAVASSLATAVGQGNAASLASASAVDGTADVTRAASSDTWAANGNTNIQSGDGAAHANTAALTTGAGSAQCKNTAAVGGAGSALATVQASDLEESHVAAIECRATASGQSITIVGIPSSDPGVPGQLYISSGVLKVSL